MFTRSLSTGFFTSPSRWDELVKFENLMSKLDFVNEITIYISFTVGNLGELNVNKFRDLVNLF